MTRDPVTKQWTKVTPARAWAKRQKAGEVVGEMETIEVWQKDPNQQAAKELLDRLLDQTIRPIEAKTEGDVHHTIRPDGLGDSTDSPTTDDRKD